MEITITLPETFIVESRNRGIEVQVAKLTADLWGKLALHGLTQKVADAASTAGNAAGMERFGAKWEGMAKADKTEWLKSEAGNKLAGDHAVVMMKSALDTLYAGDWSIRGQGGTAPKASVDPVGSLAVTNGKNDLLARIKKNFPELRKFADMATHGVAGKYFTTKGDVVAWDEQAVQDWMKDKSGKDYWAEAKAFLEAPADEL
jgi:hypothetical protein